MKHLPSTPILDPALRATLHAELAAAARTPAFRPWVLDPQPDLAPRFVGYWRQLSALPRRTRRSLQRRWKRSLAAIALLMALGQVPALAAAIAVAPGTAPDVNADGKCALIEAIVNANDDAGTHVDCVAGSGADTLVLSASSTQTLTQVDNSTFAFGYNGLPVITSRITIEGNGSTIRRAGGAPAFRIFLVDGSGDLTLNETTVSGGAATGSIGGPYGNALSYAGGGILVASGGRLSITNSTVSHNSAVFGGGLANFVGTGTLMNSTISGNSATASGGGLFSHVYGALTLTNSTVSDNSAGERGGGLFNIGTLTLTNSTVSGNNASSLGGGLTNAETLTLTNTTVSGNRAGSGGGLANYGFDTATLGRTMISGNTAARGAEMYIFNTTPSIVIANNSNLFGHSGLTDAQSFYGFTPGPTDLSATANGDVPTALGSILDTTLANHGGATKTHALVAGSPAVDAVGSGCPPPATDQRGFARPMDGDGDGGAECDVGAFELAFRPLPTCETAEPTRGCTVNGVAHQICRGTAGHDEIFGTPMDDIIFGLNANDRINGLGGNDLICGGKGHDVLLGKQGRDRVFGGPGNDNLQGGSGDDQLFGEAGKDLLFGDRGNDALDGGADTDKCHGGPNGPTGDTAIDCETVFGVP